MASCISYYIDYQFSYSDINRMNENVKENGVIPGMGGGVPSSSHHNTTTGAGGSGRPMQNVDIKLLHAKKQQAEMRRNQKEEDLRENHPFFDRPLFWVPRESTFRKICQAVVGARYLTWNLK